MRYTQCSIREVVAPADNMAVAYSSINLHTFFILVCSSAGMADGSVVIFVIIIIYFVVTIRDDVQSLVYFPSLNQDFDNRLQKHCSQCKRPYEPCALACCSFINNVFHNSLLLNDFFRVQNYCK